MLQRSERRRSIFLWIRVGLAALVCLAVLQTCRYYPPLIGTFNYKTYFVTDPGLLGSPLKLLAHMSEAQPCSYTLLGWSQDNQLYYRATCYGGWIRTLRYNPQNAATSKVIIPDELYIKQIDDATILAIVRAHDVRPSKYEEGTRPLLLVKRSALASPDNQFFAFITRRVYSVHDIVVLQASERKEK